MAINITYNNSVIKSIQKGLTTISGTNAITFSISEVDISKTVVNYLGSSIGTGNSIRGFANIRLASSTTLTVSMGDTVAGCTHSWEVIEYV